MAKKAKNEVIEAEIVQPTMASGVEQDAAAHEIEARTSEAPAPKTKKSKKTPKPDITLEDLAAKFLQHLEDAGKSNGTLFSYKLELITALAELGKDTNVAELTPARVLDYFVSDRVTRTRAGVQKAKPTIDKCRRVLRMALQWAEDSGLIAQAPLPEASAPY
jgi:hypothetical protein